MIENDNKSQDLTLSEDESLDFDALEQQLDSQLKEQLSDLDTLEIDHDKIGNPDTLGTAVMNVVWDQFINQVGEYAGEDFIRENRGLNLDLRDSAHIQTTENFAEGKIASHNTHIDYQQRHDDWQSNFQHDSAGNVVTHHNRVGKEEANLVGGARARFDQGRPTGSTERGTDMDHTVSAAEIIRDAAANAHLTQEEQVAFANSSQNLNEIPQGWNRSKSDLPTQDWLDNPNSKGQKPKDQFADPLSPDYLGPEQEAQLREKDKEARDEYERIKKEGEERSVKTGKQSQKEEAIRIGKATGKAVLMGLLAELIKNIIRRLVSWFKSGDKSFKTFISQMRESVLDFFRNIKQSLLTSADIALTTIATAIFGPIVSTIKKAWIIIKQGYASLKEAIAYIKNPNNKKKPISILMMEVGKIIIAGTDAAGAVLLSGTIEGALSSIPALAFPIPGFGSLAQILGIFFAAIVSGIIGAIALHMIDKAIAKKQKQLNEQEQFEKRNEILKTGDQLVVATQMKAEQTKQDSAKEIANRHQEAVQQTKEAATQIEGNSEEVNDNTDLVKKNKEEVQLNQEKSEKQQARDKIILDDIDDILNNL